MTVLCCRDIPQNGKIKFAPSSNEMLIMSKLYSLVLRLSSPPHVQHGRQREAFEQIWISSTLWYFLPSSVETNSVVKEKNVFKTLTMYFQSFTMSPFKEGCDLSIENIFHFYKECFVPTWSKIVEWFWRRIYLNQDQYVFFLLFCRTSHINILESSLPYDVCAKFKFNWPNCSEGRFLKVDKISIYPHPPP